MLLINFDSLRKVLTLEQNKGYQDSAVFGGLETFLGNWLHQSDGQITSPRLLSRLKTLFSVKYVAMSVEQRREWLNSTLAQISDIEKAGGETLAPAAAGKSPQLRKLPVKPKKIPVYEGEVDLESPVTTIKGISVKMAEKFAKLGVRTIRDLLYFFPHRHLDYTKLKHIDQLKEGEEQTIVANVWQAQEVRLGGRRGTEAIVGDASGNIRVVWFNQPYLAKKLLTNSQIVISGKVSLFKGQHVFNSPEWEPVENQDFVHTGRLVPVYSLTQGLRPRQMRTLMKDVVDRFTPQIVDFLPQQIRNRVGLLELSQAISQAHYPEDEAGKDKARTRLAFDELFLLQLGVMKKKRSWQDERPGCAFTDGNKVLDTFLGALPFAMTPAQEKALGEILTDLKQPRPMSRLLQGDVGSGKTVVATAALLLAAANGYQAAFMAPTEILAEQHFATICQMLSKLGQQATDENLCSYAGLLSRELRVALLTGDMKTVTKQSLQKQIKHGEVDIVIGTHALIQKGVDYPKLGMVVVDEQHRFGVEQRSALRQKGFNPHMLVMTATPIPRTLALTLYGDLDLSVIDQLPPGRQTIKTKWLQPRQRESAYVFIRRQVAEGRQAFIICPLIEESEAVAAQAAVAEYEHLSREVFPDLRLGLLHGRMSGADKDEVMNHFRYGELDILVSTPVIEVGIDVPNATVMMVESADRFGLSQLHQFRGRVGRGKDQSYCMLLAENPNEVGVERLDIIENVYDGFKLAEEDLRMRGPGEFFGTRQSGLPDLRMARLSDVALLEAARSEAMKLFQADPQMEKSEHRLLAGELSRIWTKTSELS